MLKTNFCFVNMFARPEKYSLAIEDRLTRELTKNFKKKSIAQFKETLLIIVKQISSESFRCL